MGTVCVPGRPPLVVGFQVEKMTAVSQSKSNNVWIYNTLYTSYTSYT
jgi:hypothetical protein